MASVCKPIGDRAFFNIALNQNIALTAIMNVIEIPISCFIRQQSVFNLSPADGEIAFIKTSDYILIPHDGSHGLPAENGDFSCKNRLISKGRYNPKTVLTWQVGHIEKGFNTLGIAHEGVFVSYCEIRMMVGTTNNPHIKRIFWDCVCTVF